MQSKNILQKTLSQKKHFTEALFKRPQSLASLLPYEEYLEKERLFLMKDGSLGAVFRAELLEHESMTEKEVVSITKSLKPWLSLPSNCTLQILFEQKRIPAKNEKIKEIEASYKKSHPVSQILFNEKVSSLKKECLNTDSSHPPMERSLFISIRFFPKNKKQAALFKEGNSTLKTELHGFLAEMREFQSILASFETNSQIKLKRVEAKELLSKLREFFNPKTFLKRSFSDYNPSTSLSEQFLYNSPTLDYAGIEREGLKTRTITLKTSPLFAYPGGMSYFTKLDFPFHLSLNFSFPAKEKTKRFFDFKEFFLSNTPTARGKYQLEEVKTVQDRLARDDRCLQLTFCVVVEGRNQEELDERTRKVCSIFNNELECEVIQEEDIGLGLCLNTLPLSYSPEADHATARAIRILRSDAVHFLPVFDSFKGLTKPISIHLSRENNLVPFSLLEDDICSHTVVVANSGAGKSAFIVDCLASHKRLHPEPLVFIIDKKSSYSMLAEYFEGDITVFDRNKKMPFSPFRGRYDEEKIAFLTKLFLMGIQMTSPSFVMESEYQTVISQALKQAYIKKQNRKGLKHIEGKLVEYNSSQSSQITMDDFIMELGSISGDEKLKEVTQTLLLKLRPFYGDGP